MAAVLTVLLVTVVVFLLLRVAPGDVALNKLSQGGTVAVDPAQLATARQELGLNRPIVVQYLAWLGGAAELHFGQSLWTGRAIGSSLRQWLPVTIELAVLAFAVAILGGLLLGVAAAAGRGKTVDYIARSISVIGISAPSFWIGTMLILVLVKAFHWIPPVIYVSIRTDPVRNLVIMVFPSLVLGFGLMGYIARLARSTILDVAQEDFVRTARAKGLERRVVVMRHILRNALPVVMTLAGAQLVTLLGGAPIVEQLFALPGLGRGVLDALKNRDFIVVQDVTFLFAIFVVLANLAIDLLTTLVDPRIRVS